MTSAGALYEKVAFDRRSDQTNDYGQPLSGFSEAFTRRAAFKQLRGSETALGARIEGRQPIEIVVRRDSDTEQIATNWRVRDLRRGEWANSGETDWDGMIYSITAVQWSNDRRWIQVTAVTGGDA